MLNPNLIYENQKYVHLMLGSKGGIGKTYVLCYLAEYMLSIGKTLTIIDTDTANSWLKETKFYNAVDFDMFDTDKLISFEKVPEIFSMFPDRNLVIDTGANSYSAWFEYLSNGGDEEIQIYGSKLMIHVPITPGSSLNECIRCLEQLVDKNFNCRFAIWLNNSASPKSSQFTIDDFDELPIFKKMEQQLPFVTELPTCDPASRKLVNEIHDNHYALSEIADASDDKLSSYTLYHRPASAMDKFRANYYRDKILNSFNVDINPRCFHIYKESELDEN